MAPRLRTAPRASLLLATSLLAAACSTTPALTLTATPSSIGGDGQSTVTATAKVTAGGAPAPDGTAVTFTVTDGTLESADSTPAVNPLSLEVDSASGASTALLLPPRRGRGTITITATASFNGATVTQSQVVSLTPAGGLASSLTLTCSTQNVGGLVTNLTQPIHVLCTPKAYDASNNEIKNASIEPYAEAGSFAWQLDSTSGKQQLVYTINPGATRPLDVDPFGPDGKPRPVCPATCINDPTMCDAEPCWVENGITHNPRDGVATLMVAVPGVPGFFDQNSNGEPFVDADDDGARGASEFYIDVNGNGKYDSADSAGGTMQNPRMLWRAYRIIWSGSADVGTSAHSSNIRGTVGGQTLNNLTVRFNDGNYNKLAAVAPGDGFALSAVCSPDGSLSGNAFMAASGIPFDPNKPGIVFDPVSGDISGPGFASTYRQETDTNLQTVYASSSITGNTGPSNCTVSATATRTYDPGVPGFDSNGSVTGETVSGTFSFGAPPDAGP